MQVQPPQQVEVDGSTYHYEDYLADMGNTASAEQSAGIESTPPMEQETQAIGRLQAITGAKAVETKVKPRGPKADAADYDFVLVRVCAGMVCVGCRTASAQRAGRTQDSLYMAAGP
jgi:hypothetical protein